MANFDAINLVISAEDRYSEEFAKAGESTEKVLKKTQNQIKIERAELEQYMDLLIATTERRKQQQLDIQQMQGASRQAGQKELERLIKLEEKYQTKVESTEENYQGLLKVREDLEDKKFETMKEYFDYWENGNQSVLSAISKTNLQIRQQTGLLNKAKAGAKGYSQAVIMGGSKATQQMKKFGNANADALNQLNSQAPMAVQALQDLGGQQFGQTIAGLTGIAEQLAEMKKITEKGGEISGMMKLGLITQALNTLKPVVQGAIGYFRDFAGAAMEASEAVERNKQVTASWIERNDTLTSQTVQWMALTEDVAEKEKLWAGETDRLADERTRLTEGIKREKKELTALSGMWGKYFQAEDKKMVEARLAGFKEELAALKDNEKQLNKGRSEGEKRLAAEEKRQARLKYFTDINLESRHKQYNLEHADDKRQIARHALVRKILEDKKRGMEWEQGVIDDQHRRLNIYHDLLEKQERQEKKLIKQKKDAADLERKQAKEKQEAERKEQTRKQQLMALQYEHMKNMKEELAIRQEQLKATGLYTNEEIKKISEQEQEMRKLKKTLSAEQAPTDVENANVGRLLSGQTTEKMTEAQRKQIDIAEKIRILSDKQLKALQGMFVTELASGFSK
tara:strand:- start:8049 stop:9923 length:1875 start_codon:yes stop_codon:yes gene_type:complete